MTNDAVARFADSLRDLDVGLTRTTAEAFRGDCEAVVETPAVGVPPPFDGVALPESVDPAPSPADLDAARTGVTAAAFAVADYGSLALASTPDGVEPVSLFPERHVAVVRRSDVLPDMEAAFDRLGPALREGRGPGETRSAVLATGPSATADMGALVRGAHGPEAVHVLLLEGDDE